MKKNRATKSKFIPLPINTDLSIHNKHNIARAQPKTWINSARYLDPPLSPIMMLMDSNERRSSVHSVTPILMKPISETHDDNDHLSVSKNNAIPSYTSQFSLKLNMKSHPVRKKKKEKRDHKGTPHPEYNYKTVQLMDGHKSSIQKRKRFSTSHIQKQRNHKPHKVIPRTPIPMNSGSDSDSDSDSDSSSFDDHFPFEIPSVPASKSRHVENNVDQLPTNIRSRHTFQTAESSLLDHEDEYDPPRPSLRMIISDEYNNDILIKEEEDKVVENKIVCQVVEEDNDDESGCDVNSEVFSFQCINDMMYHSEDEIMADLNLKLLRDRSRSLSVEKLAINNEQSKTEQYNLFSLDADDDDDDTLSTMSTISTLFTDYKPRKHCSQMKKRSRKKSSSKRSANRKKSLKRLMLQNKWSEETMCGSSASLVAIKPANVARNVKIIRRANYDENRRQKRRAKKSGRKSVRSFEPSMKILSEITTLSGHGGRNSNCSTASSEHEFLLTTPAEAHSTHTHHACDISASDSVDIAYAEYIGTEYGIGEHLSTYSESTNLSSYYDDSECAEWDPQPQAVAAANGANQEETDWQKALQAAYLSGFNKGYSLGVQYQISVANK